MNSKCMAFTVDTEEELAEKWSEIPDDTDILITHGPKWGTFDRVGNDFTGSQSLLLWISEHKNTLQLHVHGHIHEYHGIYDFRSLQKRMNDLITPVYINCSYVNERYQPVNKPITIEIENKLLNLQFLNISV